MAKPPVISPLPNAVFAYARNRCVYSMGRETTSTAHMTRNRGAGAIAVRIGPRHALSSDMLTLKSYLPLVCALLAAGCSESPASTSATLKQIGQFSVAWQYPIPSETGTNRLGVGHYLAFDSQDHVLVGYPKVSAVDIAPGCAEIDELAPDGTKLAAVPYDKSDPPKAPFTACASQVFIETDKNDALIMAGMVYADNVGYLNEDIVLRKLDTDGKTLWTRYVQNDIGYVTYLEDLVLDAQNNVFIAASIGPADGGTKPWVGKYDPQGNVVWTYVVDNALASIQNMEVDTEGNVWLNLLTEMPTAHSLLRLSAGGEVLPPIAVEGSIRHIAKDYLLTESDDKFRKYSTSGTLLWETAVLSDSYADAQGRPLRGIWHAELVAPDGSIYGLNKGHTDSCVNSNDCIPFDIDMAILTKVSGEDGSVQGAWYYELPGSNRFVYDRVIGNNGDIVFASDDFVGMVAPVD